MAKKEDNKKSFTPVLSVVLLLIIIILVNHFNSEKKEIENHTVVSDEEVVVHIIDVGQGSSALIQCGKNGILIDAGEIEYGGKVCGYIKEAGVENLEYVIASHPHSDHIGGLIKVLKTFPVGHVITPYVDEEFSPTTATYEKFLTIIDTQNIDCTFWEMGEEDSVGIENVTVQLLAPLKQNENMNNMSIICRVAAFKTVFMFPGDAEKTELRDLMKTDPNVSCDIMIMSHHGSATALDETFLKEADFSVGVISCGSDNSYGHPHREVLDYFYNNQLPLYRTDQLGTIRFTCSENGYAIESEKG